MAGLTDDEREAQEAVEPDPDEREEPGADQADETPKNDEVPE